jgi:hypothetical protein
MPFAIYLKKSSFLPRNAAIREAAANALVRAINQRREKINDDFEIQHWVVVI